MADVRTSFEETWDTRRRTRAVVRGTRGGFTVLGKDRESWHGWMPSGTERTAPARRSHRYRDPGANLESDVRSESRKTPWQAALLDGHSREPLGLWRTAGDLIQNWPEACWFGVLRARPLIAMGPAVAHCMAGPHPTKTGLEASKRCDTDLCRSSAILMAEMVTWMRRSW